MAWAAADLSSTVRALAAADKPLILASNVIRSAGGTYKWTAAGGNADASITDSSYPTTYLHDSQMHLKTRPNASGVDRYLNFDFGAAGVTFDSIAILNHNLGTLGTYTVLFQIDNVANFASATTIATMTSGTSTKRLVSLDLKDTGSVARSFSGVQYARLKLSKAAGGLPQIGEVILGSRRQLKHQPEIPWDEKHRRTTADRTTTDTGITTTYVRARGQRLMDATLSPAESTYIDDLRSLYESDMDFGRYPFLWIDKPATSPQAAYWMQLDDLGWQMRLVGPTERQVRINAYEQGPQFVGLEA